MQRLSRMVLQLASLFAIAVVLTEPVNGQANTRDDPFRYRRSAPRSSSSGLFRRFGGEDAFPAPFRSFKDSIAAARRKSWYLSTSSVELDEVEDEVACMDPLDELFSSTATIHNASMCEVNCEAVVANARLGSALAITGTPALEEDSIGTRSGRDMFRIAIEVPWKYTAATLGFLTRNDRVMYSVEVGDIGVEHMYFANDPAYLPGGVWSLEYTKQCHTTFVASIPWRRAVYNTTNGDAPVQISTNQLYGTIRATTEEPLTIPNSDERVLPDLIRTWRGDLQFGVSLPTDVTAEIDAEASEP